MSGRILDLAEIARAIDGVVRAGQVLAPGPGHPKHDRSLSVKLSDEATDGFIIHSFAGDDWKDCREYVAGRLGLASDRWKREREDQREQTRERTPREPEPDNRDRALWLWQRRNPVEGTVAETYLRRTRGYSGLIPATIGFLPARGDHAAAMISAFGIPTEPEPGVLSIAEADVRAVHLTRLTPEGAKVDKITLGRGAQGSPIVVAPCNDLLGLSITEGIEDALSVHASTGLGAWAAGSAGFMPALADTVPTYVEHITIFADANEAGERNSRLLADRLGKRGFQTTLKTIGRRSENA